MFYCYLSSGFFFFFFFNDTATTEIYTLSLHDALPISSPLRAYPTKRPRGGTAGENAPPSSRGNADDPERSEEHTSELQSRLHLVCRLLLEKKKNATSIRHHALRILVPAAGSSTSQIHY